MPQVSLTFRMLRTDAGGEGAFQARGKAPETRRPAVGIHTGARGETISYIRLRKLELEKAAILKNDEALIPLTS
jgi:hypothetical protein